MDEDDTFKALKRLPFIELRELWRAEYAEWAHSWQYNDAWEHKQKNLQETWSKFLADHYWTEEQYITESQLLRNH